MDVSVARNYRVDVGVETAYVDDQSAPEDGQFVFAYTITITNTGTMPARLLRRHWVITDADNNVREVRGDGVVGEQPHLDPGESFQYTSGAVLATPVGSMQGSYNLIADDGVEFDAPIPPFNLAKPNAVN